jgi:predicted ATPase
MVRAVGPWGAASFENDPASDWFLLVEEAVDPGRVITSALDSALGEADYLGLDAPFQAIAAAELSASCAGHAPERLPDHVRRWVDAHPHRPYDSEIDQAVQALRRVRAESELRDLWDEDAEGEENRWLREVDDLIARLGQSGAGDPARSCRRAGRPRRAFAGPRGSGHARRRSRRVRRHTAVTKCRPAGAHWPSEAAE